MITLSNPSAVQAKIAELDSLLLEGTGLTDETLASWYVQRDIDGKRQVTVRQKTDPAEPYVTPSVQLEY